MEQLPLYLPLNKMTYQQTLDYLFSRLPMFQRIGAAAYKPNLDNTYKIATLLGDPQKKLKCIHVAGTNGKGSSSHMLAAILQQAGYKVGLYTSPHLIDFRERITINGKMIAKEEILDFVEKYKTDFEAIEPSFFEWTVGLAFHYFVKQEVDVAVIEVGLGGRLDSTNIITPVVSLITNIGFDHMNLLGDTLQKIAGEKAGIIKAKIPVVVSEQQTNIYPVFTAKANELKATIQFAEKRFKIINYKHENNFLECDVLDKKTNATDTYKLDLTGKYQLKNLLGVLNTIEVLIVEGFIIEKKEVQKALSNVVKLTKLNGRWQTISEDPLIIADTAHNVDGIKQVLENLKRYSYKNLHMIFGTVNDKDIDNILQLLPNTANYYFVKASVPRALESNELQKNAFKFKLKGEAFQSVETGLQAAKKAFKKGDLIFVGGSTFVVGDMLSSQ
ncbi:MAG: folylpolyglutamate synthase/dihydrofolate synthase family protein [Bacteroidota bacterium]|nr:folylpolyglutamate synthase/dihydrofolate synthase family protein [Bacteroidota bacterium]